ncbi:cyanoexosortase A [Nostoc sp. MS1]|uniref:cyanoexosortase A n=1 Tax=Nostoc sp. MS1 TaxID=2764711 RepID=UPI001CC5E237|nr:cyanoexosortase A [Nostoc sp. MS1]
MQNKLSFRLKSVEFLLLAIGGSLIAINLTIAWRNGDPTSFYITLLFLLTVYSLIKEKCYTLDLKSEILSSSVGALLLLGVFIYSTLPINIGVLFLFPTLTSGLGLALLASGYKGIKQYYKELLLLSFLTIRSLVIMYRYKIDISLLTAKLSTAILWYTGFKVNRSGIMIHLPTGSVEVYSGCSGIDVIMDMLSLAVMFIAIFDLSLKQKFIVPIVAASVGFVVNSFRVALMAIIVGQGNKQAFQYWHDGDGSIVFSMIASLVLCGFCWFLLNRNEQEHKNTTHLSE